MLDELARSAVGEQGLQVDQRVADARLALPRVTAGEEAGRGLLAQDPAEDRCRLRRRRPAHRRAEDGPARDAEVVVSSGAQRGGDGLDRALSAASVPGVPQVLPEQRREHEDECAILLLDEPDQTVVVELHDDGPRQEPADGPDLRDTERREDPQGLGRLGAEPGDEPGHRRGQSRGPQVATCDPPRPLADEVPRASRLEHDRSRDPRQPAGECVHAADDVREDVAAEQPARQGVDLFEGQYGERQHRRVAPREEPVDGQSGEDGWPSGHDDAHVPTGGDSSEDGDRDVVQGVGVVQEEERRPVSDRPPDALDRRRQRAQGSGCARDEAGQDERLERVTVAAPEARHGHHIPPVVLGGVPHLAEERRPTGAGEPDQREGRPRRQRVADESQKRRAWCRGAHGATLRSGVRPRAGGGARDRGRAGAKLPGQSTLSPALTATMVRLHGPSASLALVDLPG